MIHSTAIHAAAKLLHERLSARIEPKKRKLWDDLKPSTRKQYLDIAHAMLDLLAKG